MSAAGGPSKEGFRDGGTPANAASGCCGKLGGVFCCCFVIEDCRKDDQLLQQSGDEEVLFCTLCNAEVYHISSASLSSLPCIYSISFSSNYFQMFRLSLGIVESHE